MENPILAGQVVLEARGSPGVVLGLAALATWERVRNTNPLVPPQTWRAGTSGGDPRHQCYYKQPRGFPRKLKFENLGCQLPGGAWIKGSLERAQWNIKVKALL